LPSGGNLVAVRDRLAGIIRGSIFFAKIQDDDILGSCLNSSPDFQWLALFVSRSARIRSGQPSEVATGQHGRR
jgi:hypothetical protein